MTELITSPEFEALHREIEKLKTELSMLVLERDSLKYVDCKNIETAYLLAVGALEHQIFNLHCDIQKIKRKIELVQAQINRQEAVDLIAINSELDKEFEAFQEQLDKQIRAMQEALERNRGEYLSEEETKELKQKYRFVVKALHPDVHPDLSESKRQLFQLAIEAYAQGDLETMRVIAELLEHETEADDLARTHDQLERQKKRLLKSLARVRAQIEKIKSEYPYTLKEMVASSEALEERRQKYQSNIVELERVLARYEERLERLLSEHE